MNKQIYLRTCLLLLLSSFSYASPPQPSFRYFGLLSDEYGWPVLRGDNTVVLLKSGTNECARFTANELLGNGINYILEAAMEGTSSGERYAPYALHQGETVTVAVVVNGIEQPLMGGSSLPVVGKPGATARVDLNLGTDQDHDGLSDQWETALIINNSGGLYTNISQVLPGDDFDGDRVSNMGEFGAGTAPEWEGDVFEANNWMMNADGLLSLCFYTKHGLTYQIFAAPQALSNQGFTWTPVPFRTSPGSSERMNCTAAQSSKTFFYVTPTNTYKMYRLEIIR